MLSHDAPLISAIANEHCHTGENPLWHPVEKRLYWLDIPQGMVYRFDPALGAHERIHHGPVAGGFTFQADGSLLLFGVGGAVMSWANGTLTTVLDNLPFEEGFRFNDVIADAAGQVLAGTVPYTTDGAGRLYRFGTDGTVTMLLNDIPFSNGLGFSQNGELAGAVLHLRVAGVRGLPEHFSTFPTPRTSL